MDTPNYMTLTDVAQLTHKDELVEMSREFLKPTSILNSMQWAPSTDALSDVSGVVEDLPSAEWTGLDKGVKASKGKWGQRIEGLAMLESWAEINEKTYNISPHKDAVRWENERLHMQKMGLAAEEGLLYGNPETDIRQPLGILTRFNTITDREGKKSGVKKNYITLSAGGSNSGSMGSVLLMAKGPMCPTLLYPRYATDHGLVYRPFDFENVTDDEGGNKRVARTQFSMTFGVKIPDRQTCVRIANVDPTSDTSMTNLEKALYTAFAAIGAVYRPSVEIWAPVDIIIAIRQKYAARVVSNATQYNNAIPQNAIGDILFDRFVIRQCDSMLMTESTIS